MHITRSASYAAFQLSSWPLTLSLNCVNNYIMCGFSFLGEKQHILRFGNCFSCKFNQLLRRTKYAIVSHSFYAPAAVWKITIYLSITFLTSFCCFRRSVVLLDWWITYLVIRRKIGHKERYTHSNFRFLWSPFR